ncbi:hypothetical protein [Streptomyces inhibens]|uniref:hypothetical protein n=1 Tax=Streptomyces inhibens TaxID=2293571 RepID=UPI001EE71584|nr:hypothetical protein [Streptomyces inhibens]
MGHPQWPAAPDDTGTDRSASGRAGRPADHRLAHLDDLAGQLVPGDQRVDRGGRFAAEEVR